jgi:hypothetical protein
MLNDKALRAKYIYLTVAGALSVLRSRPPRADLEREIEAIRELHTDLKIPDDEYFIRPGNVIGHVSTMAHNCIYHYELGDYRERKAQAASEGSV